MEGPDRNNERIENRDTEIAINTVEHAIQEILPINQLQSLFGPETYLIGGAVRGLILGENIDNRDFDLMTRMPLDEAIKNLESAGYTRTEESKFSENQFSMKDRTGVVNLLLMGREVQVGFKGDQTIESLIATGDVNLNCCAFSLENRKIINPEVFEEILEHRLLFCDPESAKKDPMKLLSALKIISRMPQIRVEEETQQVIQEGLAGFVDFFEKNPDRRHKLRALFGNINSGEVMQLFSGIDQKGIFGEMESTRVRPEVSVKYNSSFVEDLSDENKQKIVRLIREKFGQKLEEEKLFNAKIKSAVYKINEHGEAVACCLMDRKRIYLAAAIDSEEIVSIVADLCYNNDYIWTTISINRNLLINLSLKTGLHPVADPMEIQRILVSNYPEYAGKIKTETIRGRVVFTKDGSMDGPQLLLLS
jgi:hypothetical protein